MVKIIACKTTEIVSGQMKKITVDGKEIIVSQLYIQKKEYTKELETHLLKILAK